MKSRTRARSVALQVLYEIDIARHSPTEVLALRLEDAQGVPEGESRAGSLSCRFVPKTGEPIESRTFVTVLVGGAGWDPVP